MAELLAIARRYTFAFGQGYLSSFLSSLSMMGLVLAIALLIVVLSVMNGFDKEMRERILSLVPHITVLSTVPVNDWEARREALIQHPDVVSATPFSQLDGLLMRGETIEATRVTGLDFTEQQSRAEMAAYIDETQWQAFLNDDNGIILGAVLAESLGVTPGDTLALLVPSQDPGRSTRAASYHSATVRAILTTGTELDQVAAVTHIALASKLAGLGDAVSGLRLTVVDIFDVPRVAWELINNLPPGYYATNWMMSHGNLYAAIQLSRDLVSILLFSIIGVAAFNVVSSLVLVVFDKRSDIAILRTLGISPRQVAAIFILQGAMIGLVGVVLGGIFGVLGSLAVPSLVAALESLFQIQFLNTDVYPVSFLPVDILLRDVLAVGGVAFVMCLIAAVYPAFRAARLAPASVLHQD